MAEIYEKQIKQALTFCVDRPCQTDLNRAIIETMSDIEPEYSRRLARLYADHLSAGQLQAAILFAESPDGQAITEAKRGMTDDMADVGNAIWKNVSEQVSRRFCPRHKDICVDGSSASNSGANPTAKP
jgi:hypothetical protein